MHSAGRWRAITVGGPPGTFRFGREGEILRCPWHGWEFDVTTGRSIFNPHAVRVRAYPVAVEAPEFRSDESARSLRDMEDDDSRCAGIVSRPAFSDQVSVETYPVSVERKMVVLRGVATRATRA